MPVPVEGVFDLVLGSDVRSGSELMAGGIGDRDGLEERCDICEPGREIGTTEASDALRVCSRVEVLALLWLVRSLLKGCAACADAITVPLAIFLPRAPSCKPTREHG